MSTQLTNAEIANEETQSIEKAVMTQLNQGLADTRTNFPIMVQKVGLAKAALSAIKKIESDEDDAKAETCLVRVRATHDLVKGMRMEITKGFDGIKERLMEPEKEIGDYVGSEYVRVKGLRDAFLKEKIRKENETKAKAEAERRRGVEFARLKAAFETRFFDNVVNLASTLRQSLAAFVSTITLETYEAAAARLNVKPSIKADTFESWFQVQSTLSTEDINTFLTQVRAQYTYESINGKYLDVANPILQEYRDKLPTIKQNLEVLATLSAEKAEEAKKELDKKAADELAASQAKDQQLITANAAVVTDNANMEALNATFQAQLTLQAAAPVKGGIRKNVAVIDCEPKDIVKVFAGVLLACFQSPEFGGYVKRDKKTGMPLPADEDGIPQYEKWAEQLLAAYAEIVDKPMEGIRFIEKVSSVARKAKA